MNQCLIDISTTYNNPSSLKNVAVTKPVVVVGTKTDITSIDPTTIDGCQLVYKETADAPLKVFDIDFDSLSVTKAEPKQGCKTIATIVLGTNSSYSFANKTVDFSICKKGCKFNERNVYSYDVYGKTGDTVTSVASKLRNSVNATSDITGFIALSTRDGDGVVIEQNFGTATVELPAKEDIPASKFIDFDIVSDFEIKDIKLNQQGQPSVLDTDYVKNLYHQCYGGKGVNYLAEDGKELYNLDAAIPADDATGSNYYLDYTLKYKNKRKTGSGVGDDTTQTLHLCVKLGTGIKVGQNEISSLGEWFVKAASKTSTTSSNVALSTK